MNYPSAPAGIVAVDSLPRPTWVRWRVVALLLAFSFMSWFNRVSMSAAYDERIQNQLHISEEAIGWVYSALLFAYMLFMTPGGWLADRIGPRGTLALMGFGSALFVALTGVVGLVAQTASTTLLLLLVIRALMGAFTAPIYPASGRALLHWLPARQRAGANGAIMGAALLGIACTYFGFGVLLDRFDWPTAFLITGGVTAVLAVIWTCYATNWPRQHPGVNAAELHWIGSQTLHLPIASDSSVSLRAANPSHRLVVHAAQPATWWTLLHNRSLMLLTLSYAAIGYFEYLFYFWMHYYFDGVLKLGKTESRVYAMILYLAMAAGMFLGGWISDRLQRTWGRRVGRTAVAVGGMLGGAILLGVGLLATEPAAIVVWFALALAAVGATEGPLWATALELGGRQGGTAAGIFNTGGNAGGAIAPIATPLVSQALGWLWGIGLGSLVCLVGVILWFWIDPSEGEGEHTEEMSGLAQCSKNAGGSPNG